VPYSLITPRPTPAASVLAGLHGEFVIDGGAAWVAVATPVAVTTPAGAAATLLTTARVPARRASPLAAVVDLPGLDAAIEQAHGPVAHGADGLRRAGHVERLALSAGATLRLPR
jgi:hypothetical protein